MVSSLVQNGLLLDQGMCQKAVTQKENHPQNTLLLSLPD